MEKKRKYGNEKAYFGGHKFDSLKEMKRFMFLQDAQRRGEITDLELQPKYELIPAVKEAVVKHLKTKDKVEEVVVQHAITYRGDFRYKKKDGEIVVEDVKASPDVLTTEYKLKEKMMYYFHRIHIRKVYKATEAI